MDVLYWVIHWPNKGTVQDFVNNFVSYISKKTNRLSYVMFTWYLIDITMIASKVEHAKNELHQFASRCHHQLNQQTPLWTVTSYKIQLINIICK